MKKTFLKINAFLLIILSLTIFLNINQNKNNFLNKQTAINQTTSQAVWTRSKKGSENSLKVAIHEASHALFFLIYELIKFKRNDHPFIINMSKISITESENHDNVEGVTMVNVLDKANQQEYQNANNDNIHLNKWKYWYLLSTLAGYISTKMIFKNYINDKNDIDRFLINSKIILAKNNRNVFCSLVYSNKHDYCQAIKLLEGGMKYFKTIKGKTTASLEDIVQEVKNIISKPRYINVILLLAEALLISKKINRAEVIYIFQNNKLPTHIIEKGKTINDRWKIFNKEENTLNQKYIYLFNDKDMIEKKLVESKEQNNLFKKIKNSILNNDVIYNKLKVKNQEYSLSQLGLDRKSKSINTLSDDAIKELNFLKNQIDTEQITLNELQKEIDAIFGKDEMLTLIIALTFVVVILMIILVTFVFKEKDRLRKNTK